jgi:hypothetical protein
MRIIFPKTDERAVSRLFQLLYFPTRSFKMARTINNRKVMDVDNGVVTHTLPDGRIISLALAGLSEGILKQCTLLGLSTTVGNACAGQGASLDKVFDSQVARYEQLKKGEWKSAPVGSGNRGPDIGIIVEALVRLTNADAEQLTEQLEAYDQDALKTLRNHAEVRAMILKIRAERAEKESSTAGSLGDLLASLGS